MAPIKFLLATVVAVGLFTTVSAGAAPRAAASAQAQQTGILFSTFTEWYCSCRCTDGSSSDRFDVELPPPPTAEACAKKVGSDCDGPRVDGVYASCQLRKRECKRWLIFVDCDDVEILPL